MSSLLLSLKRKRCATYGERTSDEIVYSYTCSDNTWGYVDDDEELVASHFEGGETEGGGRERCGWEDG